MDGEELKTEGEPVAQEVALTENKTDPKDTAGVAAEKRKRRQDLDFNHLLNHNHNKLLNHHHSHSLTCFNCKYSAIEGKR